MNYKEMLPVDMRKEIKNTIIHLGKYFDFNKILLLVVNKKNEVQVAEKSNNISYHRLKLYDDDHIEQRIKEHFRVKSLIPFMFNETNKGFLAIDYKKDYPVREQLDLTRFFTKSIQNYLNNENMVQSLDRYSKRIQRLLDEMMTLHEFSRALDSGENIDILLNTIMEKCQLLMNAESASLMLVIKEENELEFKVALGPKADNVKPFRLPIGRGIAGWVAEAGESVLIPDAYNDERFDPSFDQRSGYRTRSILCVPMIHRGEKVGVMTVLNRLDGNPFSENDELLLTIFASQGALSILNTRLLAAQIEKERLDKELQVAADIQNLLIPQEIPKIKKMSLAATYIPCKEVSGDFYDIISLKNGQTIFVCADVSGKGIPGAMVVSDMQASLYAYLDYTDDLLSIVDKLNHRIIKHTTSDRYITFFIGMYNPDDSTFEYINAGHNPPLLIKQNEEVVKLKTGGIFIGFMPFEYDICKIPLEKNELLCMYTDGLVEAMDPKEEEFGEERLIRVLIKEKGKSCNVIKNSIIKSVNKHQKGEALEDDFTLIVARVN